METKFDVIILTEIGARNLSVVINLFQNYNFHYLRPHNNNYGGVGIYTHDSLLNVLRDDVMLTKSCNCSKCEFESLFIEFMYNGLSFTLGGIYRHPSGNVTHFVSSLETILTKLDDRKNVILAGDMHNDLIKHTNENVISYMSTMMSTNLHWSSFCEKVVQGKSNKYIVWRVLLWYKRPLAMFYISPVCQQFLYRKYTDD